MKKLHSHSFIISLFSLFALSGCGVMDAVNTVKAIQSQSDYAMIFDGNKGIYNAKDGNQYKVPPAHKDDHPNIMVCYGNSGLFGSSDEAPLRVVANEVLESRGEGKIAGEGKRVGGYGEGTVCYDFEITEPKPIGAYLDEETGEVVVVGESY